MKKIVIFIIALFCIFTVSALAVEGNKKEKNIQETILFYFDNIFIQMKDAALQNPTPRTFRKIMKPLVKNVDGIYGATLVDSEWVIRQVYFPTHFLARRFSLKKVKQLEYFYKLMDEKPAPQLSEPGHGSLVQPRLIAMRYPIIKDGVFDGFVSLMVRTPAFLKAVGLDKVPAYKIICLDVLAEERGKLSEDYEEIVLDLPSTKWIIQYDQ